MRRKIPLTLDTFYIPETPFLRIKMNVENGKTIGLIRQYNEGSNLKDPKD